MTFDQPVYIYESVHRVEKTLQQLKKLWYNGLVFVARELTKIYEQYVFWTIDEIMLRIQNGEIVLKGEFVLWFLNSNEN